MIVAVFSDIHSNYHAFKACYEDAVRRGADSFIFLGDYVSDLSEPQKTMDLVYEIRSSYPTVCLRGNREGYMLDCAAGVSSFTRGSKTGSLLFTYDHLRKKDLDFFRKLKISDTITIGGVQMEIAHAAMDNDRYYFDSDDGHTADIFPQMQCDYLLTGHSHKQYMQRKEGKTIINPGSVGLPQDGTQNSKYALLDIADATVSCNFREVPYDMTDAIRSQFSSGLVDSAKYWAIGVLHDMITADDWVLRLLKRVQEAGNVYDEAVWHAEAVALGMKLTAREILNIYQSEVIMTTEELLKLSARELVDMGICPTCFNREYGGALYGDNSDKLLYEDEEIECFFVGNPRAPGHMCISTIAHYHDMSETPDYINEKIVRFAKRFMQILCDVYGCERVYLCTMCDGPNNHYHVQLIPRYPYEKRGSRNFVKERKAYQFDKDKFDAVKAAICEYTSGQRKDSL